VLTRRPLLRLSIPEEARLVSLERGTAEEVDVLGLPPVRLTAR